ncbi:MAG: hypothetical protein ACXVLQ_02410 [Bacteriovorax sp.]
MKTSLFVLVLQCFAQSYAATYTVPVDSELKDYATLQLETFKTKDYEGATTIRYKIPKVLTGVDQVVEFNGSIDSKANSNVLTGANGTLTCAKQVNEKMECRAEYKNLQVNEARAIDLINKISMSSSEASGRIAVMRAFSSDPVGIINY